MSQDGPMRSILTLFLGSSGKRPSRSIDGAKLWRIDLDLPVALVSPEKKL